jgi:hypothetical protein
MRLIAVSRVLNEDDIIEAFVRHHAPLVDHHVMLDNGSNDRTIEILRALKQEGARITVLQNRAPMFTESRYNTGLFRLAAGRFAANWVLFLDCDEFLDERRVPGGLRARLTEMAGTEACLLMPMVTYHPMPDDDASESIVPRRIRKRDAQFADVFKLCIHCRQSRRIMERHARCCAGCRRSAAGTFLSPIALAGGHKGGDRVAQGFGSWTGGHTSRVQFSLCLNLREHAGQPFLAVARSRIR